MDLMCVCVGVCVFVCCVIMCACMCVCVYVCVCVCVCVSFAQCHDARLPLRLEPEELSLLSPVESQTAACAVACSSWLSLDVSSSDLSINHTSHICLLRGPGLAEQVLGCNVLSHDAHVVPIDVLDVAFAIGIYGDDVLRPAHHLQLLCDDPECPWRLLPMAPRAPRRPEAALRR